MRIPKFIIILFLLAFIWGIGYIFYLKNQKVDANLPTTSTGEVMLGTLVDTINVNGTAELANEQKLRFWQNGKVADILVKVGDHVEKNAVLAVLDKREFFQELAQAQNRIDKTRQSITEELDKAHGIEARRMEREIASMERKLEEAQEDFDKAVKNSPSKAEEKLLDLNAKKRDLVEKQNKYKFDKESFDTEFAAKDTLVASKIEQSQKILENTIYTMDSQLSEMKQTHNAINKIFGFDMSKLYGGEGTRASYVGSNDPARRVRTEELWKDSKELIGSFENMISGINRSAKKISDAEGVTTESLRVYKKFLETIDAAAHAANATPVGDDYGLTSGEHSSLINEISSLRSTISGKISSLNETRDLLVIMESPEKIKAKVLADLDAKKFALEAQTDALKRLEIQIQQEEESIKVTPAGFVSDASLRREILDKQSALQDQKDALQTKKEEFAKLTNGKSDTLQNLQTTLKDQLAELEKLHTKEESYEIRAPFEGTVRTIKIKVGDILGKWESNDSDKIILLENSDIINVKVAFNQLDIIKVALWQEADMSFDAVPDALLRGKITEISSTPQDTNGGSAGLAMYGALISAPREDYPIYSGMNANITLTVGDADEVLLVPIVAVTTDLVTGESYVNVVENGSIKKTPVTTGKSANGKIEIISGLFEGQVFQMIDFNANTYSHTDFTNAY